MNYQFWTYFFQSMAGVWMAMAVMGCASDPELRQDKPQLPEAVDFGLNTQISNIPPPKPYKGLIPFFGHTSSIQALCLSHKGDLLLTAAGDGKVLVWSTEKGYPLYELHGLDDGPIQGIALDIWDRYVVVASPNALGVWDLQNQGAFLGKTQWPSTRTKRDQPPQILSIAPTFEKDNVLVSDDAGRLILFHPSNQTFGEVYLTQREILDAQGGPEWLALSTPHEVLILDRRRETVPLPIKGRIQGMTFKQLVVQGGQVLGHDGHGIYRWGPDFSKAPQAVTVIPHGILCMTADVLGKRALVLTQNHLLEFWDLEKGKILKVYDDAPRRPIPVMASDLQGRWMATADFSGVALWNLSSQKMESFFANASTISTVDFLPQTHWVIFGGIEDAPMAYSLDYPNQRVRYPDGIPNPLVDGEVDLLNNVYFAATSHGEILTYDVRKGRLIEKLQMVGGVRPKIALNRDMSILAILPQENFIERPDIEVPSPSRHHILLWNPLDNQWMDDLTVDSNLVDLSFGLISDQLYFLSQTAWLGIWKISSHQEHRIFDPLNHSSTALAIDRIGGMIAMGGDQGVAILSGDLKVMGTIATGAVQDLAFAPNGRDLIVALKNGAIYQMTWQVDGKMRIRPITTLPTPVLDMAASDDGHLMALAEKRGTVTFLDLRQPDAKMAATLMIGQGQQWITYFPNNLFTGSEYANAILYFREGGILKHLYSPGIHWVNNPRLVQKQSHF